MTGGRDYRPPPPPTRSAPSRDEWHQSIPVTGPHVSPTGVLTSPHTADRPNRSKMDAHLLLSVHPSAVGLMAVDFMKRKQTAAAEWGAKKKNRGETGAAGLGGSRADLPGSS